MRLLISGDSAGKRHQIKNDWNDPLIPGLDVCVASKQKRKNKDDQVILAAITEAQALLNDRLQDAVTKKRLIDKLFGVLDTPKVVKAMKRKSLELGH